MTAVVNVVDFSSRVPLGLSSIDRKQAALVLSGWIPLTGFVLGLGHAREQNQSIQYSTHEATTAVLIPLTAS